MRLIAKNIKKSYAESGLKAFKVFENLNFEFGEEGIATIYGPSGIGKSTFLNMLGTVDIPDSGEICLNEIEYNFNNYQNLRKKHIGYMFQFHYLLPEFTVFENLDLTLRIKGQSNNRKNKESINKILSDFNVLSKIDCYPEYLSGGERQRVSLARSIINNPSLVLADEPTGNLDKENSNLIIDKIKCINKEKGIKFIIATHNESFKSISDSVYSINDLRLIKK